MNHAAKHRLAISFVFCGVENVLMPELIQVVPSLGVVPWDQHEVGSNLQKFKEAYIFLLRSDCPIG
jgi:hypothetical protein